MSLFVDKYRPQKVSDIVGNEEQIQKLLQFIESFPAYKSCILYGRAGIGKTSSVYAIANEFGYYITEINASSERSNEIYEELIVASQFMSYKNEKRLVLLDEIDGIDPKQGNDTKNLSLLLKKTKCPIIMICNEIYVKHLDKVKEKSFIIKFNDLPPDLIFETLVKIVKQENLNIDKKIISDIAYFSNGDLRFALNCLQSHSNPKYQSCMERDFFKLIKLLLNNKSVNRLIPIINSIPYDQYEKFLLWIFLNVENFFGNNDDIVTCYESLSKASMYLTKMQKDQEFEFTQEFKNQLMFGIKIKCLPKPYTKLEYDREMKDVYYKCKYTS